MEEFQYLLKQSLTLTLGKSKVMVCLLTNTLISLTHFDLSSVSLWRTSNTLRVRGPVLRFLYPLETSASGCDLMFKYHVWLACWELLDGLEEAVLGDATKAVLGCHSPLSICCSSGCHAWVEDDVWVFVPLLSAGLAKYTPAKPQAAVKCTCTSIPATLLPAASYDHRQLTWHQRYKVKGPYFCRCCYSLRHSRVRYMWLHN